MKIGIIAFSERGMELGTQVQAHFLKKQDTPQLTRCEDGGLKDWTSTHFEEDDALLFIGSCGIAVRAIAPFVKSKLSDPAVVVVDELRAYCVALLSGHIGGANELAAELAALTGALPVITTATDRSGVFAIDTWARQVGLFIANPERIKHISARLLSGEQIGLKSVFPVTGHLPKGLFLSDGPCHVLVSHQASGNADALQLVPRVLTLGIGCKKGASAQALEYAFQEILSHANCHPAAVARVCSIGLKANEPGILEFCAAHELPFITFSATALQEVPGTFSSSSFVQAVTGVGNVCERSAVLGSGEGAQLLFGKQSYPGITMALAVSPYTVRFQKGETI